jgi:transaldolase
MSGVVMMNPLRQLSQCGQADWIDNLTRGMIRSGALSTRVTEYGLRGVTSNPAIFHKAIAGSNDKNKIAFREDVWEKYRRSRPRVIRAFSSSLEAPLP